MKGNILATTLLLVISFAYGQEKVIELFNGKNLKGWEVVNGTAEFKVEGKTIIGV